MQYSANFDLELPDDFPVDALERVHVHLADRRDRAQIEAAWADYSAAASGLIYRFRAADEDMNRAVESLRVSNSPPQPERYRQERDLFGFTFQGLSAIECLFFAVYFVGAMIEPTQLPPTLNRRDVVPRLVADRCDIAFTGDVLPAALRGTLNDVQYSELGEIRNFLSHRGAPGRAFHTGGPHHGAAHWNFPTKRLDITRLLDPNDLLWRRAWLGQATTTIVRATDDLVKARVP